MLFKTIVIPYNLLQKYSDLSNLTQISQPKSKVELSLKQVVVKRLVGVLIKRLNEALRGNLGAVCRAAAGHNLRSLMTDAAAAPPMPRHGASTTDDECLIKSAQLFVEKLLLTSFEFFL